jgi:tudor domain-containing protein 1/4/6/7
MDTLLTARFIRCNSDQWVVELKLDGVDVAKSLLENDETANHKVTSLHEQNISANYSAQVYVSHSVNLGEFYLQLTSSTESLENLSTRLNALYSELDQSTLQKIELGAICCAQFSEDNSWYRSIVTALPDDTHVEVQFVDYGNSDVIEKSKVKVLKDEFADIPILAVKCSFESQGVQWTDKDIEKFDAIVFDQELAVTFIVKSADSWQVRLNKDGISLVTLLKEDQERKVPEGGDDVVCPGALSIKNKEILAGQEFECGLSHMGDAGCFYIQVNDEPLLDKVTDMISEVYPSLGPSEECLGECKVGTSCCIKFSEDENWYRAVVTELLSNTEAKVLFIDFGNSEVSTISNIKNLLPEFYEIPKLAVPCRLADVKDDWSAADIVLMEDKMLEKTLKVKFVCATESGWNVMVEVEGTCLNTLPEFSSLDQVKSNSFTMASFTVNKKESVTLLSAESLSCIWVQPMITENNLTTLMNDIAESKPAKTMAVSEIAVGMPCLSKFTEDDEWYRAEVVECKETQVLVMYVDYGNSEYIDISRISPISSSFLKLPAQAVKFSVGVPEPSASLVLNKLNEEYPESTLEAEIINQKDNGVYMVKLFDHDGKDLVQSLIASCQNDDVATKEPVAAVDHCPVMSEEASSKAHEVNKIKAETGGTGEQDQEQNQEPEKEEEFFEAQENVNGHEGSGSSSDALKGTLLCFGMYKG